MKVRTVCREQGFQLIDWRPQPKGRWPDFLAHRVKGDEVSSWWVSVRMAQLPQSTLYTSTTRRLGREDKRREVPGGPHTRAIVVLPPSSESIEGDGPIKVREQPSVVAVRLPALKETLKS
jgi:hypothetical protein